MFAPVAAKIAIQLLIQSALGVKHMCDQAAETKKTLKVFGPKIGHIGNVLEKIPEDLACQEDTQTLLKNTKEDLDNIEKHVQRSAKMSTAVYYFKAKDIEKSISLSIQSIQVTLSSLHIEQNENLRKQIQQLSEDKDYVKHLQKAREAERRKKKELEKALKTKERKLQMAELRGIIASDELQNLQATLASVKAERDELRARENYTTDYKVRSREETMLQLMAALQLFDQKEPKNDLLQNIKQLRDIQEFVAMYDSEPYQQLLRSLQTAQAGKDAQAWAKDWAMRMRYGNAQAEAYNKARKVGLELLYVLCDRWRKDEKPTVTKSEITNQFGDRRVTNILRVCLVMDRAQALYHMQYTDSTEFGMHWVSKRQIKKSKKWQEIMGSTNGGFPTINKRLEWLVDLKELGLQQNKAIMGWMEPRKAPYADALSPDLNGQPYPTHTSTSKDTAKLQQNSAIQAIVPPNTSTVQAVSRPSPTAPHWTPPPIAPVEPLVAVVPLNSTSPPPTAPHLSPTAPVEPQHASTKVHEAAAIQDQTEPPKEHKMLRKTILKLKTVKKCANFYDCNDSFQGCIRLLRQAQDGYIKEVGHKTVVEAREEWAKLWAVALSNHHEWAWVLNHCRKTALELLYRVCDLSFDPTDEFSWSHELEETFKLKRIDEIIGHCLVMDRANSLYNMEVRLTGEKGLGWYSKYNAEQYQEKFGVPLNPRGPTINKRLWWLFQVPALKENEVIQRWMQIAVPVRLEK